MPSEPSQLRMGFRRFADLKPPEPVPGYGLRTFRPGDEDAWIGILNTGDFGLWDHARLDRLMRDDRSVLAPEGTFFATHDDQPVGVACIFLNHEAAGEVAELGWVGVHAEHRGRGLATQICRAALGHVRDLGHDYVYLNTEDYRVAAIGIYLRLGFEPEILDETQPARWEEVRRRLGSRRV